MPMERFGAKVEESADSWSPDYAKPGLGLALFYLATIIGAEVVTNFFDLVVGLICHTVILTALIVHSSLAKEAPNRNLLLALCLAPLTRILSLSMPLFQFPAVYWYLIIYPTLFLSAWVARQRLGFTPREIGLCFRNVPQQLLIALSGVIFGVAEYLILRPEPLIPELTWGMVLLLVFALVAGTGFVEEFVFRGVLQRASITAMGRWRGMVYVALLFAALHLIHHSVVDIIFVFLVGLFFGWIVNKTGSLLGVTLAHGITNTLVYLVIPFLV